MIASLAQYNTEPLCNNDASVRIYWVRGEREDPGDKRVVRLNLQSRSGRLLLLLLSVCLSLSSAILWGEGFWFPWLTLKIAVWFMCARNRRLLVHLLSPFCVCLVDYSIGLIAKSKLVNCLKAPAHCFLQWFSLPLCFSETLPRPRPPPRPSLLQVCLKTPLLLLLLLAFLLFAFSTERRFPRHGFSWRAHSLRALESFVVNSITLYYTFVAEKIEEPAFNRYNKERAKGD